MMTRLWRRAMSRIAAISAGRPKVWTTRMARVFGVMARSMAAGERLSESASMSAKTGVARS